MHKKVIEVGRGKSYKLLETFALKLLDEFLAELPVDRVTVRVRKETPVLDGIVDAVGVEMSRARSRESGLVRVKATFDFEAAHRLPHHPGSAASCTAIPTG